MTRQPVLASTAIHFDHLIAVEQRAARLPSLVSGVVRDGELAWWGSRGRCLRLDPNGLDSPIPESPSPDTQYRIGSITKTMTAILIMQLRDEGRLDLSDRLDQHLPGIGYGDRTLRELLSHTSGMQAEPTGPWWEHNPGVPFAELAAGVDASAAVLPRGCQYHYTNLAFGLLGEVVARLRASTWWDALHAQLLEPLGMTRTSYHAEPPAADGFSVHTFAGTLTPEPAHDAIAMAPAGQVWSTVTDLATYAGFLTDPDTQILTPQTLTEMATLASGTPEEGLSGGYGLGLRLVASGGRILVGHTGSMPGFLAGLYVDRERRRGAVCLTNATAWMRCEGLPLDLLTTLERHEPALPPTWTPTGDLPLDIAEVLGLWHWGETSLAMSYDGCELALSRLGEERPAYRYRRTATDTFVGISGYHTGETLRVVRRSDGSVSHLECATFVYTRKPYDPVAQERC